LRTCSAAVTGCASGRELAEGGFDEDVAIAAEIDACHLVPVLSDGAFTVSRPDPHSGQHRMTP
jgi:2-phosphosulfolactate phosphatase